MTSLPQSDFQFHDRAVEGSATCRPYSLGDGAHCTSLGQPEGSSLPPALEPPSPSCAGAPEPGLSGAERPYLDTLLINDTPPRNSTEKQGSGVGSVPGFLPLPAAEAPPNGLCALFGKDGARWDNPGFTERPWSTYGQATVEMSFRSFQEALGYYWRWLARSSSRMPKRVARAVERRALRVPWCGHRWRVPVHQACGYQLGSHARLMEPCDSMTCVLCARRTANQRRAALRAWCREREAVRVKGKLSRDFYVLTWTVPKRPWLSVERLQEDITVAFKASKTAWEKHLQFLPKRKGEKRYPGKCLDAGMTSFLEVGAGGMVHVTALYYGPWHDAKELRACYQAVVEGGKDFDVRAVGAGKDRRKRIEKAILEVCKYVTKGATGRKDFLSRAVDRVHEYSHPLLCVLSELALFDRNRVRVYGSMRGVFGDDENEEPRAELPTRCPGCGEVHWGRSRNADDPLSVGPVENLLWTWVEHEKDHAWVPHGWGCPEPHHPVNAH